MPDPYDSNDQAIVLYLINDPVNALSNTISLLPGEFLAAGRSRIGCQSVDTRENTFYVRIRYRP